MAGSFYPGAPAQLAAQVDQLLSSAPPPGEELPCALVVPHAGYLYSGPIAASAYAQLGPRARRIRRVVLLGPSHFVPLRGMALPEAQALATPLGEVRLDAAAAATASRFRQVQPSAPAHAREHSLEVQLPFLQRALERFTILPLVAGEAEPELLADLLEALLSESETLALISTDLSHYLSYQEAREVDGATASRLLSLGEEPIKPEEACGSVVLNGLISWARRKKLRAAQLDLRNSGDTAGEKRQVVGYGAFALYPARGGPP